MSAECSGCYVSFSGPWCDNCDTWPCMCDPATSRPDPDPQRTVIELSSAALREVPDDTAGR